jgi:hypothetical protein
LESNGGEISSKEGKEALKKSGFPVNDYQLIRARKRAGIEATKDGVKGWKWRFKNPSHYSPDSSNSSDSSSEQEDSRHLKEGALSYSSDSSSKPTPISNSLRELLDSQRPSCLVCGEELSVSDTQCEAETHSFCE